MNLPTRIHSPFRLGSLVVIGASVLALGLPVYAQTTSAADAPLTDAQLREEIVALRKEIVQLQRAQKATADATASAPGGMAMAKQGMKKCKDGMNMGMQVDGKTGCMGMPADTTATDPPGAPMKKKGMGMMEKEHAMPMPTPDTGAVQDPPAAMPAKKCC